MASPEDLQAEARTVLALLEPLGPLTPTGSFVSGLMVWRGMLGGRFDGDWSAGTPALLWPLWGAALGAATLAYHRRRRGACRSCGRGRA